MMIVDSYCCATFFFATVRTDISIDLILSIAERHQLSMTLIKGMDQIS